jgi:Zn-dependent peptidase ImmA (M78 family)
LTPAEALLQELGITEPEEIELEAIAYHVGAKVRFRALCGCEAHIVGCDGQAIITVKQDSSARRKRFSIAHELRHWRFHRGKTLVCRLDEYRPRDTQSPEKVADAYAADLLMPRYLFAPRAAAIDRVSFDSIGRLGEAFKTSLTATAIRLFDLDQFPGFVISHTPPRQEMVHPRTERSPPLVSSRRSRREELRVRYSVRRPSGRRRASKDRSGCLVRSSRRCAIHGSRADGPRRSRRDLEPRRSR